MNKQLLLTLGAITITVASYGQYSEFDNSAGRTFTLSSESNSLSLGGRTSSYFEYRALKPGETNLDHNGWAIKDIDLDMFGKSGTGNKQFEYEFHYSLVDLATAAATQNTAAPTSPGIKAAYLQYVGCPVHIKLGFDKLPFSQGNISDVWATPMWSHANLYGGDFFSRRDWGLTLNYRTPNNKINAYAGAYSGMGENFFEYGNDRSGTFEYIGRVEYSFPGKVEYRIIDEENSPKLQFRIAANARYFDKTQPAGKTQGAGFALTYPDAVAPYGVRIFDGKRLAYGVDFLAKYRGLSYTFETDMLSMKPNSPTDALFNGTTNSVNHGVINAGGFVTGLHYNYQPWKSVVSVQYENINANDLVVGNQEWLSIAYAYKVSGFNSVFKIEYYKPLTEDANSNPLKYTSQLRVGYQIVF